MRYSQKFSVSTTIEITRCQYCGPVTKDCNHDDTDLTSLELEVYGNGYSDSGNISGPPENCYPPESDMDVTACKAGDWLCNGLPDGLTGLEFDEIIDRLWAETENADYPDDWSCDEPDVDEDQEWNDFDPDC